MRAGQASLGVQNIDVDAGQHVGAPARVRLSDTGRRYRRARLNGVVSRRVGDGEWRRKIGRGRARLHCLIRTVHFLPVTVLNAFTLSVAGSYSGVETGGSGGSMNRGPELLGPRVRGQKILRKKRIRHF